MEGIKAVFLLQPEVSVVHRSGNTVEKGKHIFCDQTEMEFLLLRKVCTISSVSRCTSRKPSPVERIAINLDFIGDHVFFSIF